ncbi:MAG: hypothetical protein JWQ83_1441, partial [Lacunisphaera sp.]|nr:hypothetical protein [Lacunisphaera sp.]
MLTLRPYVVPNFWTALGASAKLRQLERRGFPANIRNWRFVTLTMDRVRYPDPSEAYEVGKRHLRQFLYELKKTYRFTRSCWKLEFHKADTERDDQKWPHWHLLIDYKRPIQYSDIDALWGKGRTEIKGVTDSGFKYLFKYVTKSVADLPEWITSRRSVRLFQMSKGFLPASGGANEKQMP